MTSATVYWVRSFLFSISVYLSICLLQYSFTTGSLNSPDAVMLLGLMTLSVLM